GVPAPGGKRGGGGGGGGSLGAATTDRKKTNKWLFTPRRPGANPKKSAPPPNPSPPFAARMGGGEPRGRTIICLLGLSPPYGFFLGHSFIMPSRRARPAPRTTSSALTRGVVRNTPSVSAGSSSSTR